MPRMGVLRVLEIATKAIMAVLLTIWSKEYETSRRVRNRIG